MVSISKVLISNTIEIGFIPACAKKKKLKNVDVELQVEVGYWAFIDHLQDYKIYGTLIKMFKPEFLNSLWQPPRDNPWPIDSTNRNFRT
jgi:hypothetical protein